MDNGPAEALAPQGYWVMWDAYGWSQVHEARGNYVEARRRVSLALNNLALATGTYATAYAVLKEVRTDYEQLMDLGKEVHDSQEDNGQ